MPSSTPDPRSSPSPTPEYQPPPGDVPKRFPNNPPPLSDDGLEGAKKNSAADSQRLGSGEDPAVESGQDADDPESADDAPTEKPWQ